MYRVSPKGNIENMEGHFGGSFHKVANLEGVVYRVSPKGNTENMEGVTVIGVHQQEFSFPCMSCKKPVLIPQTITPERCVSECSTCGTK